VSKKTIVFKMPAPEPAANDERPPDSRLAGEPATPRGAAHAAEAQPDQWVRRGEAAAPSPQAPAATSAFMVDLARERELGQVFALGAALPAMLGWFWLTQAMERYRKIFAA
jgi:hypothetical protein